MALIVHSGTAISTATTATYSTASIGRPVLSASEVEPKDFDHPESIAARTAAEAVVQALKDAL